MTTSIHEFPRLSEITGQPEPGALGVVMLPISFPPGLIENGYELGILSRDDLYFSDDPKKFWIKGDVSADAHVSVLYGLITPAYEQPEAIQYLLEGAERPRDLVIENYEAFPSPYPEEEPYACIVARIEPTPQLIEMRQRLSYLPHVHTFPDWKPHATVAYVQADTAERWLEYLNSRQIRYVTAGSKLDLGRRHD